MEALISIEGVGWSPFCQGLRDIAFWLLGCSCPAPLPCKHCDSTALAAFIPGSGAICIIIISVSVLAFQAEYNASCQQLCT